MYSAISEELKPYEDIALNFAKKELLPGRESFDNYPYSPHFTKVLEHAIGLGFFDISVLEGNPDSGNGISVLCAILEALSRTDASFAAILLTHAFAYALLGASGMTGVIDSAPCESGLKNHPLFAFQTFTSSNSTHSSVVAERNGDRYLLSGNIDYLVCGNLASHAVLAAAEKDADSTLFFMVDLQSNGVLLSDTILSLGLHACPAANVSLKSVAAMPLANEPGDLIKYSDIYGYMELAASAISLGLIRGAIKDALTYAFTRYQGGKPIALWSEMKMIFASMSMRERSAAMILFSACRKAQEKSPGWGDDVITAGLWIRDTACLVTSDGIQVFGGYGYMKDYPQEKRFRDAQHMNTFAGCPSLKKLRLADAMFIRKCV